jgi:CDP-diacylglycerol--inositol 3-phosphatidyltransferase
MVSKENVLLYYPNLIGYSRVFFMALSFYFAFSNFKVALIAYSLAFFGDAVDGYIARLYNQS